MREILFRGKRLDNGEWVYGYIVKHGDRWWIYTGEIEYIYYPMLAENPEKIEVEPGTVCQYTGLTDKNGKKIFESDIVISKRFLTDNESVYCQIVYRDSAFFIKEIIKFGVDCIFGEDNCFEVVGNIFDNPELLEVEE